jgi:hypothetical protein
MTKEQRKEAITGIGMSLILLSIGATVLHPVIASGVDKLREKYLQPIDTWYLTLSIFAGLLAASDIPERIRRSNYLSNQALLLAVLAFFLYLVFRWFLPLVFKYTVGGRLLIIVIVTSLVLWSVLKTVRHTAQALRGSGT